MLKVRYKAISPTEGKYFIPFESIDANSRVDFDLKDDQGNILVAATKKDHG
ncbi:hypothetical protein HBZS_116610 [Helicobacter bizzozeronii CCUG 35545]|nr:hypothetical protein HBZS_116610 [Helicobacter bizzozeronii CCUG 35545]